MKKLKNFQYFTLLVQEEFQFSKLLLNKFAGDFLWIMWKGIVKS